MPYVSAKQMLQNAKDGGYAIAAFNIENMEMAQAAVAAAEALDAPVILQTTPSTLKYATAGVFVGIVTALAKKARTPVCLHLDHGNSRALVVEAIEAGYTSVMFDGSLLSFEENIAQSAVIAGEASQNNIPVEAELGVIGGKEDDTHSGNAIYTDPAAVQEFVQRTRVDSIAVAIGTAHGIYKTEPLLDLDRLAAIRAITNIPLVLHGASGVPESQISECIKLGISKVNFATELRMAYTAGLRLTLKDESVYDPKLFGYAGRHEVENLVSKKIALCGCAGKAFA